MSATKSESVGPPWSLVARELKGLCLISGGAQEAFLCFPVHAGEVHMCGHAYRGQRSTVAVIHLVLSRRDLLLAWSLQ